MGSILNYSADVWGYHEGKDIEIIHTKFCRKVLGVKVSTNRECLYGELGRYPMYVQRKFIMIKYWLKILNLPPNSRVFSVYCMLRSDADNQNNYNGSNWAWYIKRLLDEIEMSNVLLNQRNINVNFQIIKQRIFDIYKQGWYTNISSSSRFTSYISSFVLKIISIL